MSDPAAELAYAINPSLFAERVLGFRPDPWQKKVLNEKKRDVILNCSRQVGKSTTASVLALHMAIYKPRSTTILISPSERQSRELYDKVYETFQMLPHRPKTTEESASSLSLEGGGRVVSLPASEKTIRGYSAVDLIIEDEAARVPDDLNAAVKPMLAVSNGRMILMSSPYTKEGHFYEIWRDTINYPSWFRVAVPATECPRIRKEFLEKEKQELGIRVFNREYMCEFLNEAEYPLFMREWFKNKYISVQNLPADLRFSRRWDLAATEYKEGKDPDYTVGCLMAKHKNQYYIVHVDRSRASPLSVEMKVKARAVEDKERWKERGHVMVRMEQEPGSAGINNISHYARDILDGFDFRGVKTTGSKADRAKPFAAACERGDVYLVEDNGWNIRDFLDELCAFPTVDHDDQVDAASGAFEDLNTGAILPDDPASFDFLSSF